MLLTKCLFLISQKDKQNSCFYLYNSKNFQQTFFQKIFFRRYTFWEKDSIFSRRQFQKTTKKKQNKTKKYCNIWRKKLFELLKKYFRYPFKISALLVIPSKLAISLNRRCVICLSENISLSSNIISLEKKITTILQHLLIKVMSLWAFLVKVISRV